ncbi:MAG: cytochrome c3 family protein [Anaerolinea sp.]|nr:cytochrome c3 family protein [Anaerolinea sp.]
MRRFFFFLSALSLFALIILGAMRARQQTTFPRAPERIDQLLALTVTGSAPEGQLVVAQPVPFPSSAIVQVAHDTFFPLSDGHALDCAACHASGDYRGTPTICYDCHALDDPHNGDNGAACTLCHVPTNWRAVNFDHANLGGRDCADCHTPPPDHYAGTCASCHTNTNDFRDAQFDHSLIGSQDCAVCHTPPPDHFSGACRDCHQDTSNFRNATFDHTFPINHEGANGECSACHPGGNTAVYTCTVCHDQQEMEEEHREEEITDIRNCMACHPDGREPDDD